MILEAGHVSNQSLHLEIACKNFWLGLRTCHSESQKGGMTGAVRLARRATNFSFAARFGYSAAKLSISASIPRYPPPYLGSVNRGLP